jgi:hypothetical protein
METGIKVIHFDAYRFFPNMLAYASELKGFLLNGGILAWGIVPAEEEFLEQETTPSLLQSLEEKMGLLIKEGIPEELLMKNSLVSQSPLQSIIRQRTAKQLLNPHNQVTIICLVKSASPNHREVSDERAELSSFSILPTSFRYVGLDSMITGAPFVSELSTTTLTS